MSAGRTAAKKAVVMGAGPMGLYAAFLAAERGLDVTVLERDRIGSSLLGWGNARFFSPLDMNVPAAVRKALPGLPPGDSLLTGPEMVGQVLLPLSRLPLLYDRVRLRHQVLDAGRAGLSRKDFPGHPVRHEKPFRLLVRGPEGEYTLDADLLLDATGACHHPNPIGSGGLPAPGEGAFEGRILRRLGDLEAFLAGFRSGRMLLVGHGHSAAHALLSLRDAASRNPDISVTWAFRSRNTRPFREIPDDPLPGRAAIVTAANALAAAPPPFLEIRRAATIAGLGKAGPGEGGVGGEDGNRIRASFASGDRKEAGAFDAVAAFTGHRPDLSFLSELALDLSPATQGTRRLHALLSGATDCLSIPVPGPLDLGSGEPGFHLLGSKSYGRANTFLLRDGILHLEMILKHALG
ncbi:MAG: flavoprotein [Fibrobacteres bacterium]|nr:flavoprotein [Fibrobacterota bacterium]